MKNTFILLLLFISIHSTAQNTWSAKASFPGNPRAGTEFFGISSYGYLFGGIDNSANIYNDLWKYDPGLDQWTQMASLPGPGRYSPTKLVLNGKAYVGVGFDNVTYYTDWYEYTPGTNSWIQKASFPGASRYHAFAFGLNNKAYFGLGKGSGWYNDWYEYDPALDTWTAKTSFPGAARQNGIAFAIGSFGYVGLGATDVDVYNDMYQYNPANDSWTPKASYPDADGRYAIPFFVLGTHAYACGGVNYTTGFHSDGYEYDPVSDSWTAIADFSNAGPARATKGGFSAHGKGYIAMGEDGSNFLNDLLEYSAKGVGIHEVETVHDFISVEYNSHSNDLYLNSGTHQIQKMRVSIYTATGQQLKELVLNAGDEKTVHLPSIAAGVYFYSVIMDETKIQQGKFFKL